MFTRFGSAPLPCLTCATEELRILHAEFTGSKEEFWVYKVDVQTCCSRCERNEDRRLWKDYANCPLFRSLCCTNPYERIQVPIPIDVVGHIERSLHSSSTATTGSAYRAHSAFISLLSTMACPERYKQALCAWVPLAMMAYMNGRKGASRMLRNGRQHVVTLEGSEKPASTNEDKPSSTLVDCSRTAALNLPPANPGCESGMKATVVAPDAYGEEKRVYGTKMSPVEDKVLAHQIGPDLIPAEVFSSSIDNLKAGLAKRVQPLPFKAEKKTVRRIERVVNKMLASVFSVDRIKKWRMENPQVEEFCSSKWTSDRFRQAFEEAMAETNVKIEQTFQIKVNEALPAKGKAPRPIIQCGDRAQVMMSLPVKCFEELLFDFFESASIKHVSKYDAMVRVASHLRQEGANIIEGDGSAWDSCCNPTIRKMTENRVIRHIISVLGEDAEVPRQWMETVLADMEKKKIKGKAKVDDQCLTPIRVCIDSIRQSGHRGTSAFNYFINLVCWLAVICDKPEQMVRKNRDGSLQSKYVSAHDGKEYFLKYAFEGDDSAISTTENLSNHQEAIEKCWTSMGFRMKLVYAKNKMVFTGFEFALDSYGPTGIFIPEVARNLASSSWTCSSLVKSFPCKANEVGSAAMLARAENFKDCGPLSAYFAALGLAHVRKSRDRELNSSEAKALGLNSTSSIERSLQELYDSAGVMSDAVRGLVNQTFVLSDEQECALLHCDFGSNPLDTGKARILIPDCLWASGFDVPRR